jgi:hypothetical protein
MDSPMGGVQTTFPFGSGGMPTTVRCGPSVNIPLGADYNLRIFSQADPGARDVTLQCQARGPFGGAGASVNPLSGELAGTILGPQLNFPLPYGTNFYVSIKWSL